MKILSRNKTTRLAALFRPIAVGVVSSTASIGVSAAGFVNDTTGSLNLRNFYQNRNFVDPSYPQGKAEEWTQSFILDVRSGYLRRQASAR